MGNVRKLQMVVVALLALGTSACSGPGINAGEDGGQAFIVFAIMLIVTVIVLAFFLGKED